MEQNRDKHHGATVLVVDDEESFHQVVKRYLASGAGASESAYRTIHAYNGWQTREALERHHIDVVLLDLQLPDTGGLDLLEHIRTEREDIEVIVITAHSDIPNAVKAIKRGAFDFLAKSYENYQRLGDHIERALVHRRRRREQMAASARSEWLRDAFALLEDSRSTAVQKVVKLARQVANTPLTVLLEGESGVGKEIMARYIHGSSERAAASMVSVHLAAVPPTLLESQLFGHVKGAFTGADREQVGKFELADGGTLFLDEVGELDGNAQVKLLRVLQEREVERIGAREPSPVDVRVIAATNKNLHDEVAAGRFREDLFYRLNVVRVQVPPLRARKDDMDALIELFCAKHAAIMGREVPVFAGEAVDALRGYDWPGNIRELENLVMRLVAVTPGPRIVVDDIPPEYCLATLNQLAERAARAASDKEKRVYFLAREQFERYLVRLMVHRHRGDKRAAARALGVSLSTVKEKIRGAAAEAEVDLGSTG